MGSITSLLSLTFDDDRLGDAGTKDAGGWAGILLVELPRFNQEGVGFLLVDHTFALGTAGRDFPASDSASEVSD